MTGIEQKVLIVDDDVRNIFALKAVLKAKGFDCITAPGARVGLEMLNQGEVGVVLLDMMMPEMDGYEAIREIRRGPHQEIPVIAVTAQAMVGDKEKCMEAGANGYLSKPIDVDQLLALLNQYMK
jgi:two-component system, cell cycle response regulator DivK